MDEPLSSGSMTDGGVSTGSTQVAVPTISVNEPKASKTASKVSVINSDTKEKDKEDEMRKKKKGMKIKERRRMKK